MVVGVLPVPPALILPMQITGTPGVYVRLEDTIRGFREILDGKHDDLPEQAFYMVGDIESAVEKAKTLS